MADLPKQNPSEPKEPLIVRAMRWTAYPISAITGGIAAHVSMRNSIFSRLKKHGLLEKIVDEHEKQFSLLKRESDRANGAGYNIVPKIREENIRYKREIATHMEKLGFKNSWNYWKGIHDTERLEAALLFGTVGGIFLGVMLTLADNKGLQQFFSAREKNDNQHTAA